MIKTIQHANGKKTYQVFGKVSFTSHRYIEFSLARSHGAYWITVPFCEVKIKRDYKGHNIC